jgi:pyridoxal phosphate enzyme (YggS family)
VSIEVAEAAEIVRRNLDTVRERIARAATRSGRDASEVRLMAVTKAHPFATVEAAARAGVRLFGENRVQEAVSKWMDAPSDWELHLIGHLQRNKAKTAAGLFHTVQSIDKKETAAELHRHCVSAGRACRILLEVNTSGESTKSGVRGREALLGLLESVRSYPGLEVLGLMTVGPLDPDMRVVRRSFSDLREMRDACRAVYPGLGRAVLSMGMSGDFEVAVEEGSTMVRLGTALFGPRAS